MKKSKNQGITLIALIVTIIILLILAGVTIGTLGGENGILTRADQAVEEMKYQTAEEKVKLAVLASYGDKGTIEDEGLKENINKIEGLYEKVEEINYDLTIKVDGYEFKITKLGQVTYLGKNEDHEEDTIKNEINKVISMIEQQATENREDMEIDELIKKIEEELKNNGYIVEDEKVKVGDTEIAIIDHIGEVHTSKIEINAPKNSITTIIIGEKEIGRLTQNAQDEEGEIQVRTKNENQQVKAQCVLNGEVIYEKEFEIDELNDIKMYPCEENNDGKALYWYGMEFTNFESGAVQYGSGTTMSGGTCTKNANNINLYYVDNSTTASYGIGLNCYEDLTNYNVIEMKVDDIKITNFTHYYFIVGNVANNYYYRDANCLDLKEIQEIDISNINGKKYISILNFNAAGAVGEHKETGSCSFNINKIVLRK